MDAELFEERAVFKIRTPVRIKGIGCPFDLTVPLDFGVGWVDQLVPNRFTVRRLLFQLRRKFPFASQRVPVSSEHPRAGLFWMSAFGPLPETLPEEVVHFPIRVRSRHMAVVIGPAPNDRVERADQVFLTQAAVAVDGHRAIELRLRGRLVTSREQLLGLRALGGAKAFGLPGDFVSRIEIAARAAEHPESFLHDFAPTSRACRITTTTVREHWESFGGAAADFCQSYQISRKSGRICAQNDVTRSSSF